MGCLCSCLRKGGDAVIKYTKESELTSNKKEGIMKLSKTMSSPSLNIEDDGTKVSGYGLGLVGVSIEQDAAYWEWHLKIKNGCTTDDIRFGVSTTKNQQFYTNLEDQDDVSPATDGTALMKSIRNLEDGDVIGVAVQQSDLPMIQFLVNGEPYHELAINRFRGTVYPSIFIAPGEDLIRAEVVFPEADFIHMPPHARFGPVIVARGII